VRELIRTNDTVRLSWLVAVLADQDIEAIVFDTHASVLEGSVIAIQRRLMVVDEDYIRARALLAQVGELPGCGASGSGGEE